MSNYVNVSKPGINAGLGIKTKDKITFISFEDINFDLFPPRIQDGITIQNDIDAALKQDATPFTVYCTKGTVEVTSNSEGDNDAKGFIQQLVFSHPGSKQEIREFKAKALNDEFIILVEHCNGEATDMLGEPCDGMMMQVNFTSNNDGTASSFTFNKSKGREIAIYTGAMPNITVPAAPVAE